LPEERSQLKRLTKVLTTFCVIFTIVVGAFMVTNFRNIVRMLEVGLLVKTQSLKPISTSELLEGAVRGMVESLEDPYSGFMTSQEFREMQRYIQGSIGGIGIYVGVKDKNIVVQAPIEGTPAHKAGIKSDDIIVKINDTFTADLRYDEAVAMMRGEPGTQVRLSIMREGVSNLLEFTLTREIIDLPTVASEILPGNPKIGYMRLRMFASNSDEAFAQELAALQSQGIQGLVLDLRDNPGGDLESAVNIAKNFVPKGPVVFTVNRSGITQTYESTEEPVFKLPVVILINGGSASASEVLSGALKDTKVATLIGEKTFGKGIVQAIFPLGGGDGLKLTTSKYLTPAKIDIHEKGIEPDISVARGDNPQEDLQLKKAVEVLSEQIKQ